MHSAAFKFAVPQKYVQKSIKVLAVMQISRCISMLYFGSANCLGRCVATGPLIIKGAPHHQCFCQQCDQHAVENANHLVLEFNTNKSKQVCCPVCWWQLQHV